ncbi:hypothetical protein ACHAXT_011489 [Thalassiosira profunda]
MGVDDLWRAGLGDFRKEERQLIKDLPDKRLVIDTSSWVHKLDGIHEVAYARTCTPRYPHIILKHSFAAKVKALQSLGITPLFVFDGISPNMKKRENEKRRKTSSSAREKYNALVAAIKKRLDAGGDAVSAEERADVLEERRKSARPIAEEYSYVCQWMEDSNIAFVQAPFEADAQLKQLIVEGAATAAITEDGDLVVFGTPHILSQAKIDTKRPEKSDCQYFEQEKLKSGEYNSPISVGERHDYLAEISCLLGNDFVDRKRGHGPATVFATGGRSSRVAVIDSFIQRTTTEEEWLQQFEEDGGESASRWTADRFIRSRNLILHYPVFKKDANGKVTLQPLNPLPDSVSHADWGDYIGFDKHPAAYFSGEDDCYERHYNMTVVGSTGKLRTEQLGPRYSEDERFSDPATDGPLLPLFAHIDFDKDPVDVQPTAVLRAYLLNRGVETTETDSDEKIREWTHQSLADGKRMMPPSLQLEPAKWVGFEPLEELHLNDDYDDWNHDYVTKLRGLKTIDDAYIDKHFGTERAQYERLRAFRLLKSGCILLKSIKARNVQSDLREGKHLVAFVFECLSSERKLVHNVYVVFENGEDGEYVPAPCSYCGCENGAFFCSHMLCFLYLASIVQRGDLSQTEFEEVMPVDRRTLFNIPCLIENIIGAHSFSNRPMVVRCLLNMRARNCSLRSRRKNSLQRRQDFFTSSAGS